MAKGLSFGEAMCKRFDGKKVDLKRFEKKKLTASIIDASSYKKSSKYINMSCPHCKKRMRIEKRYSAYGMIVDCLGCKNELSINF